MPRTNLWSQSVTRAEIDQRSRAARLRFERIDQLFIVRPTMAHSRLRAAALCAHGRQIRRVAASGRG
jgi:hypothetical protein